MILNLEINLFLFCDSTLRFSDENVFYSVVKHFRSKNNLSFIFLVNKKHFFFYFQEVFFFFFLYVLEFGVLHALVDFKVAKKETFTTTTKMLITLFLILSLS